MKNILLSVIIPAYNRVAFLETTVNCFVDQIKTGKLEDIVEVVISNDASKDDTGKYVDKIVLEHSFIRGFNQPKNLGVTKNIDFLVDEARGEYILLCGEDDLLRDGALEYFIKCIREKKPNVIINNMSNIISNDNANRDYTVILENRLGIDKNIFVENWQKDHKLLDNVYNWLYMTNSALSVTFKKDLFVKEATAAKKYMRPENLYLWQGQNIIGISKYGRLLVIGKAFALHRKNETHWSKDSRSSVFFNIFDNIEVANLIKEYMPTEYQKYKKLYATFTMGGLMFDTLHGKKIRKLAWKAFLQNLAYFPENIQLLSMAIAPKLITKISPQLRKYKNYF
jgi:glycosyltransferase involved in cell wall biosynthesis